MNILFEKLGNTLVKLVRDGLKLRLGNAAFAQADDELVPLGQLKQFVGGAGSIDVETRVGQDVSVNGLLSGAIKRLIVVPGTKVIFIVNIFGLQNASGKDITITDPDNVFSDNKGTETIPLGEHLYAFEMTVNDIDEESTSDSPSESSSLVVGNHQITISTTDGTGATITRTVYFTVDFLDI